MKCGKILATLVTLSLLISVFLVVDKQVVAIETLDPPLRFEWIDDDGDLWSDNDTDGVIPYVPSIEQVPLIIQFQIINETDVYYGNENQQEAMENITLTGDALFTGALENIPGVSFNDGKNWSVPVIPTMSQGGGEIIIEAHAWDSIVVENLDIGGSYYITNGTIVTVISGNSEFEMGTNQTFMVDVQYADGSSAISSASAYLYFVGDDDGGTPGDPIEAHQISKDTYGFETGYSLDFNTTQQTDNQTIAGFTTIREQRNLTIYAIAYVGATLVYGYAKIEMKPQEEPKLQIKIERGFKPGIFVSIKNVGDLDATEVSYNISVTGGLLGFINKSKEDVVPLIEVDNETTVNITALGIGLIKIEAKVDAVSESVYGLIFFKYVYIPLLFDIQPRN